MDQSLTVEMSLTTKLTDIHLLRHAVSCAFAHHTSFLLRLASLWQ